MEGECIILRKSITLKVIVFLLISLILLTPISPVCSSESDKIQNPYGENRWIIKGDICVISEMNDTDGYKFNQDFTDTEYSFVMKNETDEYVFVIMKVDLMHNLKHDPELDYTELKFKIRKEDNVAFLAERNHPLKGYKLGFFPFLGYCKNNTYPEKIGYMGRISEKVTYQSNVSIPYPEEGDPQASRSIGGTIHYNVKEDPITIKKVPKWVNTEPYESIFMQGSYKVHNNKYFPVGCSVKMSSGLFYEEENNPGTYMQIRTMTIGYDYNDTNYQFLKEIEMQNLYEENPDDSDSNLLQVAMVVVPVTGAIIGGYLAYRKKRG